MRSFKLFSLVSMAVAGFAVAAAADQTSPVTVVPAPVGQGEIHVPATRATADLVQSYVEEEFFVSGLADIYTYNETPVPGEIIIQPVNATFPQTEDVPYTTRIIIKWPANVEDFSGTLVIEWWNSTAGFDTAPVWDPMAEFAAREGWIYVGVTNSTTSIDFLKGGCLLLGLVQVADCQTRYAALDMSPNGIAYDMVSQIANMLKNPADPQNPLPAGYTVDRLYHAGQSQQGGSMVTYATSFHAGAAAFNDAYFVQAAGTARRINFGPVCGDVGAPAYPECTPALTGLDRLVATDLPVPVVRTLTETDVGSALANGLRQTDTATFHYYEIAGASHVTTHKDIEVIPGLLLESFCLNEMNTLADGQVLRLVPAAGHVEEPRRVRAQRHADACRSRARLVGWCHLARRYLWQCPRRRSHHRHGRADREVRTQQHLRSLSAGGPPRHCAARLLSLGIDVPLRPRHHRLPVRESSGIRAGRQAVRERAGRTALPAAGGSRPAHHARVVVERRVRDRFRAGVRAAADHVAAQATGPKALTQPIRTATA